MKTCFYKVAVLVFVKIVSANVVYFQYINN